MKVMRIILAACVISMLPLKALAWGDLHLVPKLGMEDNRFAPSAKLEVQEPVTIFTYKSMTGIDSYPVGGQAFYYAISTDQAMVFELGKVAFGPHFTAWYSTSEQQLRNTVSFQFSYRLWE